MRFQVHVQPRSSRDRIVGPHGAALKVQVRAPAVGGAANDALREIVARTFGVGKRVVKIVRGELSRDKLIEVEVLDEDAAAQCLVDLFEGRSQRQL